MEIDYVLLLIHLIVGSILIFYALRALKRTKFKPMVFLCVGLILLVLGETVVDEAFSFLQNDAIAEYIAEGFEIAGFIALIIAVKKS